MARREPSRGHWLEVDSPNDTSTNARDRNVDCADDTLRVRVALLIELMLSRRRGLRSNQSQGRF
jgi:hypothetical protein